MKTPFLWLGRQGGGRLAAAVCRWVYLRIGVGAGFLPACRLRVLAMTSGGVALIRELHHTACACMYVARRLLGVTQQCSLHLGLVWELWQSL